MSQKTYSPKEIYTEALLAEKRIRPHILETPLLYSRPLSKLVNGKVYLKLENEQHTGSFKARGSLNKLMSLSDQEKKKGVITASTGNHALGFSRALEITNINGTVFLPPHASKAKIDALSNYPAELKYFGKSSLETELHAKDIAQKEAKIWVSPYNDPDIIAGQGTIGLELKRQVDHLDYCLVTIGGGGLISGIASVLKSKMPDCKIIGCQPVNSHEMTLSLAANKIVDMPEELSTLSDGSAGGIEPDAITFPLCQELIDECLLSKEDEIADGIMLMLKNHKKIIEGSAAVTIACLLKNKEKFEGKCSALVICGGNIELKIISELLNQLNNKNK